MSGLAVSSGLDLWRWYHQSDKRELEQSTNLSIENPETTKTSTVLACLSIFKKPSGYSSLVTEQQQKNALANSSEPKVEDLEVEDDLSDDKNSRCGGCTLF